MSLRKQASWAKMMSQWCLQSRHATWPNLQTKLSNEPFSLQTLVETITNSAKMVQFCQDFGSNWFKLVYNGSNSSKMVQTCSEWFKLVQNGSTWFKPESRPPRQWRRTCWGSGRGTASRPPEKKADIKEASEVIFLSIQGPML